MCIIVRDSMNYKFTPATTILHLYDVLYLLDNTAYYRLAEHKGYITIGDMLDKTTVYRDFMESTHSNAYHIINEAMQQISFRELEGLYHSHDGVDMSIYQLVSIEEVRYAKSCVRAFSSNIELCDTKYYHNSELMDEVFKVMSDIKHECGIK